MKKILIFCIALFCSLQSFSQQDSTTIEQYCAVIATPRLLSSKVTINIDYGESRNVWKDNRLKTEEGKVKKFNTVIDALNYMGSNAFPVSTGTNSFVYNYVFRKIFLKEEGADTE